MDGVGVGIAVGIVLRHGDRSGLRAVHTVQRHGTDNRPILHQLNLRRQRRRNRLVFAVAPQLGDGQAMLQRVHEAAGGNGLHALRHRHDSLSLRVGQRVGSRRRLGHSVGHGVAAQVVGRQAGVGDGVILIHSRHSGHGRPAAVAGLAVRLQPGSEGQRIGPQLISVIVVHPGLGQGQDAVTVEQHAVVEDGHGQPGAGNGVGLAVGQHLVCGTRPEVGVPDSRCVAQHLFHGDLGTHGQGQDNILRLTAGQGNVLRDHGGIAGQLVAAANGEGRAGIRSGAVRHLLGQGQRPVLGPLKEIGDGILAVGKDERAALPGHGQHIGADIVVVRTGQAELTDGVGLALAGGHVCEGHRAAGSGRLCNLRCAVEQAEGRRGASRAIGSNRRLCAVGLLPLLGECNRIGHRRIGRRERIGAGLGYLRGVGIRIVRIGGLRNGIGARGQHGGHRSGLAVLHARNHKGVIHSHRGGLGFSASHSVGHLCTGLQVTGCGDGEVEGILRHGGNLIAVNHLGDGQRLIRRQRIAGIGEGRGSASLHRDAGRVGIPAGHRSLRDGHGLAVHQHLLGDSNTLGLRRQGDGLAIHREGEGGDGHVHAISPGSRLGDGDAVPAGRVGHGGGQLGRAGQRHAGLRGKERAGSNGGTSHRAAGQGLIHRVIRAVGHVRQGVHVSCIGGRKRTDDIAALLEGEGHRRLGHVDAVEHPRLGNNHVHAVQRVGDGHIRRRAALIDAADGEAVTVQGHLAVHHAVLLHRVGVGIAVRVGGRQVGEGIGPAGTLA